MLPACATTWVEPNLASGIFRMLARSLTALGSLQHSLESGHLRLGLCCQNRQLLEDLRQDTAAAFTALSGLVLGSTHGVQKGF